MKARVTEREKKTDRQTHTHEHTHTDEIGKEREKARYLSSVVLSPDVASMARAEPCASFRSCTTVAVVQKLGIQLNELQQLNTFILSSLPLKQRAFS